MSQTIEKDPKTGRFLPGNSGFGGRPKGSRNKLAEAFVEDLYQKWLTSGNDVIERVIEQDPASFLRVVAQLMPKDINLNVNPVADLSDEEILAEIKELHEQLAPLLAGSATRLAGGTDKTRAH